MGYTDSVLFEDYFKNFISFVDEVQKNSQKDEMAQELTALLSYSIQLIKEGKYVEQCGFIIRSFLAEGINNSEELIKRIFSTEFKRTVQAEFTANHSHLLAETKAADSSWEEFWKYCEEVLEQWRESNEQEILETIRIVQERKLAEREGLKR